MAKKESKAGVGDMMSIEIGQILQLRERVAGILADLERRYPDGDEGIGILGELRRIVAGHDRTSRHIDICIGRGTVEDLRGQQMKVVATATTSHRQQNWSYQATIECQRTSRSNSHISGENTNEPKTKSCGTNFRR
jgi:hypothetical protein